MKEEKKEKKTVAKEPKRKKQLTLKKELKNRDRWVTKYFKKSLGQSDEKYEGFVDGDYEKAISRSLQLSSLEKKDYRSSVLIAIPAPFKENGDVKFRFDHKYDGTFTLNYNQALITILFFGAKSLFYYKVKMDHHTGNVKDDLTGEFNFADVVHLKTELRHENINRHQHLVLDIIISLSNGENISVNLRNHRIHANYNLTTLLTETETKTLDLIKKKVRDAKLPCKLAETKKWLTFNIFLCIIISLRWYIMKFYLSELKNKPSIEFTYDYTTEIKEHQDILAIELTHIKIDIAPTEDKLTLTVFVDVILDLACAKTLKPVTYHLKFDDEIIFSNDNDGDYLLETQLDLTDIIFGYIISEKPYIVYHPDAEDLLFETKKTPHPAFADLDKIIKK